MISIKEEKSLFIEFRDKLLKIGRFKKYFNGRYDGFESRFLIGHVNKVGEFDSWSIIIRLEYDRNKEVVRVIFNSIYRENDYKDLIDNFFDKLNNKYKGLKESDSTTFRSFRQSYIDTDDLGLIIEMMDYFIKGAVKINLQLKGIAVTGRKRL